MTHADSNTDKVFALIWKLLVSSPASLHYSDESVCVCVPAQIRPEEPSLCPCQSESLVVCEVDEELVQKLKKFRFRKETNNAAIISEFSTFTPGQRG